MKKLITVLFLLQVFRLAAQQPTELVIQLGHNGDVVRVDWSADGKYFASACSDGAVKIWDAKLGLEISTFYDYSTYAKYVSFSPDSKYLLTTGANTLVFRNVATGRIISRFYGATENDPEREAEKGMAVFSPTGKYCFADMEDNTLLRWEAVESLQPEAGEEAEVPTIELPKTAVRFSGHTSVITGIAVSSDEKWLVTCSKDKTIRIWDAATGAELRQIKGEFDFNDICITRDNKQIISLDDDTDDKAGVRYWDIATGKQLRFYPDKRGLSKCISISKDGQYIAIGNLMKQIRIYQVKDHKLIRELPGHSNWVNSLAFSSDNRHLVSSSYDHSIRAWDIKTGNLVKDLPSRINPVDELVFDSLYRKIIITTPVKRNEDDGKYPNRVSAWETVHGIGIRSLYTLQPRIDLSRRLNIDNKGSKVFNATDSSLLIYDLAKETLSKKNINHIGDMLYNDREGMLFYQQLADHKLYTMRPEEKKPVVFADYPDSSYVCTIDFSANGKWMATGDIGPDIYLWDLATGRMLRNFNYVDPDSSSRRKNNSADEEERAMSYNEDGIVRPNAWIYRLKFSPDNKLLAAACRFPDPITHGTLIIVWDLATGKLLHWKGAHDYPVQSIGWSPDGKYIITSSNDRTVKMWEYATLADEEEPAYMYQHDYTPKFVSFTPDQQRLISAGIDGKIIIRDAVTRQTKATLIGLDSTDYVAVTPEQYYAASKNGVSRIAFRRGNEVFPAGQFDIRYNRPDKVLEALGSDDTLMIRSYRQAYYKRIKKLNIDTASFRDGFSRPAADFDQRDKISFVQTQPRLSLRIKGTGNDFALDRFNVWINSVPLYGQRGISIKAAGKNSLDTTIEVKLSGSENFIETSVIDINGTESYKTPLVVQYSPAQPVTSRLHFIGIGIDRFADSRYNLRYSSKDIRDLSRKLKEKYKADISIDTLFNEQVTVSNIKALKQKLQQTGENDKVVVAYSGHGMLSKDFDYYLSTWAVNFEKPEENGLGYDELEDLLDSIPARRKLMLIDACHSGEVDKEELVTIAGSPDSLVKGFTPVAYKKDEKHLGLKNSFELMQNLFVNVGRSTGATIISAAAGTQFALERNDLKNGVFTYCILEAMRKYPSLRISELKTIVGARVEQLTNGLQKPTSRNETVLADWKLW